MEYVGRAVVLMKYVVYLNSVPAAFNGKFEICESYLESISVVSENWVLLLTVSYHAKMLQIFSKFNQKLAFRGERWRKMEFSQ